MKRCNEAKSKFSMVSAGAKAKAEHRKAVIEFYETTANFSVSVTKWHFSQLGYATSNIPNIIRKYKKRGTTAHIRPRKSVTLERLNKFEELLRKDPLITNVEAATILKTSCRGIFHLRKLMRGQQEEKKRAKVGTETSESSIDLENADVSELGEIETEVIQESLPTTTSDPLPEPLSSSLETTSNGPNSNFLTKSITKPKLYCFACSGVIHEAESPTATEVVKMGELKKDLNVIFTLRTLIGLRSEEVVQILKDGGGLSLGKCITFCNMCNYFVQHGLMIQNQIQELERKLTECRERFKKSIRQTRRPENLPKRMVKMRRFIWKRLETSLINPFIEGDQEAENKGLAQIPPQVEIKREVEVPENDPPEVQVLAMEHSETLNIPSVAEKHGTSFFQNASSSLNVDPTPDSSTSTVVNNSSATSVAVATVETVKGNDVTGGENEIDIAPVLVQDVCDICGDLVRTSAMPIHKLKEHGVLTEGFTEYRCTAEGCRYVTIHKENFRQHVVQHNPNRKKTYSCRFCFKTFFTSSHLRLHEDIHRNRGTKPYKCKICGRSFALQNYLYHHNKHVHEKRRQGSQDHEEVHRLGDARPFQCESCGKSFARTANLKYHIRFVHKKRPYRRVKSVCLELAFIFQNTSSFEN